MKIFVDKKEDAEVLHGWLRSAFYCSGAEFSEEYKSGFYILARDEDPPLVFVVGGLCAYWQHMLASDINDIVHFDSKTFRENNIKTVRDLVEKTEEQIRDLRGVGPVFMKLLRACLKDVGLWLDMSFDKDSGLPIENRRKGGR